MSDYGYDPVDLDLIRARYDLCGAADNFTDGHCLCSESEHVNALHDLAQDDVPAMLREIQQLRNVILGQVTRD
jgi:hypothetical protein